MLSQSLSGRWLQACLIFSFHLQWCCDHHGMVSWNRLKPWTNPAGPVGVVTLRNALRNSRWKLQRKRRFLDSTLGEMECMECAKIAVDLLWSWWEKVSIPSLPYMLMRNTYISNIQNLVAELSSHTSNHGHHESTRWFLPFSSCPCRWSQGGCVTVPWFNAEFVIAASIRLKLQWSGTAIQWGTGLRLRGARISVVPTRQLGLTYMKDHEEPL